jgi:AraC-like DNA-binding protein
MERLWLLFHKFYTEAMKIERFIPCEALKPFIKAFIIIESEDGMENRILPDSCVVIAFRLKGNVTSTFNEVKNSIVSPIVTGLRRSSRLVQYSKQSATLLVTFHEGGAAAFFREPLHDLFDSTVALDNMIQRDKLSTIEDQLTMAATNNKRILIVEKFFLSELKEVKSDSLVAEAVKQMKAVNGNIRIHELVKDLPISRDPFEKKFRKLIGTTPKQFASILRMRKLTDQRVLGNLSDAAYDAGFFDQSHFIKDFKTFTGQTPKDFFRFPPRW